MWKDHWIWTPSPRVVLAFGSQFTSRWLTPSAASLAASGDRVDVWLWKLTAARNLQW